MFTPVMDPTEDLLRQDEQIWNAPATPSPKPARRDYDPGTPKGIEKVGDGEYLVQSFKNLEWYRVDLKTNTCGCAHHENTGATCKHLRFATETAERRSYEKALRLSADDLRSFLLFNDYRPEVERGIKKALFAKSL